jgi:molybdopterin molybdotransferase
MSEPRRMIGATEALSLVVDHARPLPPVEVETEHAAGLLLAAAVVADRDYPPFDRSVMDGFAVRLAHRGRAVPIIGEARPGVALGASPTDDGCVEIMTGSPCPPGTEAVVMKEEVARHGAIATFPAKISPGQNIVRRGTERAEGGVVLPEGAELTPLALALLATVGRTRVTARRAPSVALLVTGDEIVSGDRAPGAVEIRDSNGPMLAAMARALGVSSLSVSTVRDTREALASALDASSAADVVVLTGGVSAGNYDLVPGALAAHGAVEVFHKVSQQPGKPILFATRGARLFFGLPGTPLGCHLGFHRYVSAAVRAMFGRAATRAEGHGRLTCAWSTSSERRQFVLARVAPEGAAWSVTPLAPRGSSDLWSACGANAYVNMPEGSRELRAGSVVTFDWLEGQR